MLIKNCADYLCHFFVLATVVLFSFVSAAGKSHATKDIVAKGYFRLPLDLTPSLSGSYGDLRATHFHAGLDLRTGKVTGVRVYAAEDGFVSRISVSPTGYGNAIYIQHPNGKTSVYGHLLDFAPEIAEWVQKKQYEKEKFPIDIVLVPKKFPVQKGDFIGRSGNSGSSGGPHLHFEIRDTETQVPLNPFDEESLEILDTIAPEIQRVNLYAISYCKSLPLRTLVRSFSEPDTCVAVVPDTFYVAVQASDRMSKSGYNIAIANYNYYFDDRLVFSFSPVSIPFDKGRYINSVVEYRERNEYGRSMVKSWVEPGNLLRTNIDATNGGLFILTDDKVHTVLVEVIDYMGNWATICYRVRRGTDMTAPEWNSVSMNGGKIMKWNTSNSYESGSMKLLLPKGSLYSSMVFTADSMQYGGTTLWRIGDENVPIQVFARLSIKPDIPAELKDKAVIACVNDRGRYGSLGGEWKGDYLEASIGSFGRFLVAVDTIAPGITIGFKDGTENSSKKSISFKISDDLSGIENYKVFVDEKWILANFDAKSGTLTVALDPERIVKGTNHDLMITVTDKRKNTNTINTTFIW